MFFTMSDSYSDGRVAHVGIYMGDGNMIHASSSKGVMITKNVLQNPYWSKITCSRKESSSKFAL